MKLTLRIALVGVLCSWGCVHADAPQRSEQTPLVSQHVKVSKEGTELFAAHDFGKPLFILLLMFAEIKFNKNILEFNSLSYLCLKSGAARSGVPEKSCA